MRATLPILLARVASTQVLATGEASRRAPQAAGVAIDPAMENRERSPSGAGT